MLFDLSALLAAVAGAVFGALIAYAFARGSLVAANAQSGLLKERLASLEPLASEIEIMRERAARADQMASKNDELMNELTEAKVEIKRLATTLDGERNTHLQTVGELRDVKGQIEKDLQILSNTVLQNTSDSFFKRAAEVFGQQQKDSQSQLQNLVAPIGEALKQYQGKLAEMEQARKHDEGQLVEQLRQVAESHGKLHTTTANLVNALRSAPSTRGRWGEQQLLRILELAGMMEHVDYDANKSVNAEEGLRRPDVVIKMPGERRLIVDAKVPMAAYLATVDAKTDGERDAALTAHANQLREHAMKLGAKNYSDALDEAPDFVVMFIPGDNLYAAAIERDPDLFEDAYNKNVIVVTPTTLLALAKAIAYGWRQESAARDMKQTIALGLELYKRMSSLGGRLVALSKSLGQTVSRYNEFLGTLEGSVLPQARKLARLPGASTYDPLGEQTPVEGLVREPRENRDLVIPGEDALELPLGRPSGATDEKGGAAQAPT